MRVRSCACVHAPARARPCACACARACRLRKPRFRNRLTTVRRESAPRRSVRQRALPVLELSTASEASPQLRREERGSEKPGETGDAGRQRGDGSQPPRTGRGAAQLGERYRACVRCQPALPGERAIIRSCGLQAVTCLVKRNTAGLERGGLGTGGHREARPRGIAPNQPPSKH